MSFPIFVFFYQNVIPYIHCSSLCFFSLSNLSWRLLLVHGEFPHSLFYSCMPSRYTATILDFHPVHPWWTLWSSHWFLMPSLPINPKTLSHPLSTSIHFYWLVFLYMSDLLYAERELSIHSKVPQSSYNLQISRLRCPQSSSTASTSPPFPPWPLVICLPLPV